MTLPSDPAYYADCYDLFAKAIASPHGVQKICHSEAEARDFRSRLHKARSLTRELSKRVYSPEHPLYNTSEYYRVVTRIVFDDKRKVWLLRLERRELKNEEIEEIMPVELEGFIGPTIPAREYNRLMKEAKDEFSLAESERDLDPSPPGTGGIRRL